MEESKPNLWAALAAAQAELKNPIAGNTAKIATKTGPDYEYDYADLATVYDTVRPVLAKHGIALTHDVRMDDLGLHVSTALMHATGEGVETWLSWPRPTELQKLGTTITYLRRYGVQARLALAVDKDDDGNAVDGKAATTGPREEATATLEQVRAVLTTRGVHDHPRALGLLFGLVKMAVEDGVGAAKVIGALNRTTDARLQEILGTTPEAKPETKAEPKAETTPAAKAKAEPKPETKAEPKAETKAEPKAEPAAAPSTSTKTLADVKAELERRFSGPAQTDGDMVNAVIDLCKLAKVECIDENAERVLAGLARTPDARLRELLGSYFIPF